MLNIECRRNFARLPTSSFDIPCSVFDIPRNSDERETPGASKPLAPGICGLDQHFSARAADLGPMFNRAGIAPRADFAQLDGPEGPSYGH